MKILLFFSILLFHFGSLLSGDFEFGKTKNNSLKKLKKENILVKDIGSHEERLELSKNKIFANELYLDFENKKPSDLKDKNNNYDIIESIYTPQEGKSILGKRYASFTTKESNIKVLSGDGKLLSKTLISEPIYFSFFVMPGDLEQSSTIFLKSYITGGKKFGIECKILNSKIEVFFHNFFYYTSVETKSLQLVSPDKLRSKVWTHVLISYQPLTGETILFENGIEKDKFFAIRSSNDPTPLLAGFHKYDSSPLIIGKDFYGKIDNYQIGRGELPDVQKLNIPYQPVNYDQDIKIASHSRGSAFSKVFKTQNSHSIPTNIEAKVSVPDGTSLELFYRFSEEPFEENSSFPEWRFYDQNSFHKTESKTFFQYFQWKVLMRSDSLGMKTPFLSNFKLNYKESLPPNPPFGLQVISVNHDKKEVCLKWNSNHEADVIEGGGYMIHYGVSSDRIVGTIIIGDDGKPILGLKMDGSDEGVKLKDQVKKNYQSLGFCINNNVIQKNAELLKDRNLLFFKSGLTYYFKLSAYNNKYNLNEPDSYSRDQKSLPSKDISMTFRTEIENRN
jgi:hypothetical protein